MVTICTASLTFNNSTFCPHSVFMCFVRISEQTVFIYLYSINWLVFITGMSVYCAVRAGYLNIIQFKLKGLVYTRLYGHFYISRTEVCTTSEDKRQVFPVTNHQGSEGGRGIPTLTFGTTRTAECQFTASAALYPQENSLVLLFVRGWAGPKPTEWAEKEKVQGAYRESNLEPPVLWRSAWPDRGTFRPMCYKYQGNFTRRLNILGG